MTRQAGDPPRFLCDEMLGKLARWLRLLGYDAGYRKGVDDADLASQAREEDRVLLTRDAELARRAAEPPATFEVRSRDPREQVEEVVEGLDLSVPEDRVLSRCSLCNVPVEEAPREDVADDLPEGVGEDHDEFRRCPDCGKVYWAGSHVDEIRSLAAELRGAGDPT